MNESCMVVNSGPADGLVCKTFFRQRDDNVSIPYWKTFRRNPSKPLIQYRMQDCYNGTVYVIISQVFALYVFILQVRDILSLNMLCKETYAHIWYICTYHKIRWIYVATFFFTKTLMYNHKDNYTNAKMGIHSGGFSYFMDTYRVCLTKKVICDCFTCNHLFDTWTLFDSF